MKLQRLESEIYVIGSNNIFLGRLKMVQEKNANFLFVIFRQFFLMRFSFAR